ncbi:MAG: hypothetical protein HYU66_18785 [Armatimonadetes bacterium]|nr:hypothetical protein [Armatimonadota bacterium]
MAAPTARAATVGLNAAKRLRRRNAVAGEELIPVLGVAVGGSTQQLAKGAVGLLREVAKVEPVCRGEALASALGALSHPKAPVAEAVAAWLETDTWWRGEAELREAVQVAMAGAAPAIAARLGALLGEPAEAPAVTAEAGQDALPALRERLAATQAAERDPRRRDWLAACLAALDGGPVPEPLDPVPTDELWRTEPAFEPPESAEQVARLMLVPERLFQDRLQDRLAQEQVLAGVRLHSAGAEAESLRRVLDPVLDDDKVGPLAWTWVTRKAPDPLPLPRSPYAWEYRRMAAIEALLRGDREPPLGTPTSASGWLDPEVFAERLLRRSEVTGYELFELSSALYRLAPSGREAAWGRLAGTVRRFGTRIALALHTALCPAQSALPAGLKLRALVTASPGPLWLRLLVAALWCRDSSASPQLGPVLTQRVKLTLGGGYLGDGLWHFGLLPDRVLAPGSNVTWPMSFGPLVAFLAPALAQPLLERHVTHAVRKLAGWEQLSAALVLRLAQRPQVALRPLLPGLVDQLDHGQPDGPPALAELLATGLADTRLRSTDVAPALSARLATRSAKPAQALQVLIQLQAEPGGSDLAAVCLEAAVATGLGDLTGAQRVQILETLLTVRGELGRPVEDPGALAALRDMAAAKGSTRTTQLAKQLLALAGKEGATSRQRCAAQDVEAAWRASRGLPS